MLLKTFRLLSLKGVVGLRRSRRVFFTFVPCGRGFIKSNGELSYRHGFPFSDDQDSRFSSDQEVCQFDCRTLFDGHTFKLNHAFSIYSLKTIIQIYRSETFERSENLHWQEANVCDIVHFKVSDQLQKRLRF